MNLYIIGNGFDLYHGLPTRFEDFRAYVLMRKPQLVKVAEKYLCNLQGNWSNLEEAFANFDEDAVVDEASYFLKSYGADDWSDSFHHDYQLEISRIVEPLSSELKEHFYAWLCDIDLSGMDESLKLRIVNPSLFLNFNYTPVLQDFYAIPDDQILHIHGSINNGGEEDIILGHGWNPQRRIETQENYASDDHDVRTTEGQDIINNYFQATFKPIDDLLIQHDDFFERLAEIANIYVWGHSLSSVDIPYFEAVIDATRVGKPHWHISYFSEGEKLHHQSVMDNLGVSKHEVTFLQLTRREAQ